MYASSVDTDYLPSECRLMSPPSVVLPIFSSDRFDLVHEHCLLMPREHYSWLSFYGNAEFAGVDNAGVDNSAPCGRDGQCRSGV